MVRGKIRRNTCRHLFGTGAGIGAYWHRIKFICKIGQSFAVQHSFVCRKGCGYRRVGMYYRVCMGAVKVYAQMHAYFRRWLLASVAFKHFTLKIAAQQHRRAHAPFANTCRCYKHFVFARAHRNIAFFGGNQALFIQHASYCAYLECSFL